MVPATVLNPVCVCPIAAALCPQATSVKLPAVPVTTSKMVSYELPSVFTAAEPAVLAEYLHHTDFPRGLPDWPAQLGVGSVASVVAAELSTVLVYVAVAIKVALAKLSFAGGPAAFTVNGNS